MNDRNKGWIMHSNNCSFIYLYELSVTAQADKMEDIETSMYKYRRILMQKITNRIRASPLYSPNR